MKSKLQKAIANNHGLYQAIFSQYQIKSQNNGFIWYCLAKTPPLYSNLVTVNESWKPDHIFRQIDQNFELENWEEWSIKDSFGVLNLNEFGFSKLFDASWFYLKSKNFFMLPKIKDLNYQIIESEELLSQWRLTWDYREALGKKIFTPKLIKNSAVFLVAGLKQSKVVSGCFINQTDDVLGISNFFAPDEDISYWSDLIEFLQNKLGIKDVVGYQRSNVVINLSQLGFENIGNLTVWIKKEIKPNP